ncbi:class I SAM-dependent methyltransferase [Dasania marina]|uniref:class I SAM-dependent methyltransferase n=1 Tax=Dasania marina TaxID=471499 RepID=UPI0030D8A474|tara:strand:- start:41892 stop:42848 length:957 start_codon:yes stop_codon:yes gene_type:complete
MTIEQLAINQHWTSPSGCKHSGQVSWQRGEQSVIACESCGYKHLIPLPDTLHLQQFYEQQFYQQERPDYLQASQDDQQWLQLSFNTRLEKVADFLLPGLTPRVLDIGCGPGSFLDAAVARGWEAVGVEPSPVAVEFGVEKGLDIRQGFFSEIMLAELGVFDMVHMSEVLEHIPNPEEVLAAAVKCLKPGGLLTVSVPNDFNDFQQALVNSHAQSEWWVVPDHHLNYFSFDSLELLLQRSGLNLVSRSTNFPMEMFLLMGQDYTQNPVLGKQLHNWRKNFDLQLHGYGQDQALERFYQAMAAAGYGRLAIVYAQKPDNK